MNDLRTPLSRAKGLGSAKEGVSHWWRQRLTSLLMLPLILWLTFSFASLPQADHATLSGWVGSPMVSIGLILLIAAVFYHTQLGLQVIIEDYVPAHGWRTAAIIGVGFFCLLFAVIGVIAVLKIALGA
ncbi:MAG: succinate dehydrogenase, hydrophobic membrane anchor protein [Gammaproteobacteria bacterium]|nr:succinate dehydrogenase, hydrophobic membrane anchor protein [Gammaproteobacteria bacterium]